MLLIRLRLLHFQCLKVKIVKFLTDECIGPTVEKWLIEQGYDARSIQSYKLQGIADEAVLKKLLIRIEF